MRYRAVLEGEPYEGDVTAEAFEPTQQCEGLAAEGLIEIDAEADAALSHIRLVRGKQLVVEGRAADSADASFFVSRVHDLSRPHESPLRTSFPSANRGASIRKLHVRTYLQRALAAGERFEDIAADWNFLLHAATILPEAPFAELCAAVALRVRGKKASSTAARAAYSKCEELLLQHVGLSSDIRQPRMG